MTDSVRPARIESAIASLPTIVTVVIAAVGVVVTLGEMLGEIRTELALVKQNQAVFAPQIQAFGQEQSAMAREVVQVSRRVARVEILQEMAGVRAAREDEADEQGTRRPRRRYNDTAAGAARSE
jgi:hypothetical protein